MAESKGIQFNMSKGRGKITRFRPVDPKAVKPPRNVTSEKPGERQDGFNLGTFDIVPKKKD